MDCVKDVKVVPPCVIVTEIAVVTALYPTWVTEVVVEDIKEGSLTAEDEHATVPLVEVVAVITFVEDSSA
jgi:hypothetical protein